MLRKIISGGQTGADVAGLDAAINNGFDHGGAIPKGRLTEAGPLDSKYRLSELGTCSYPKRTERNVLDSDGTAIFSHGDLTGGSLLTWQKAQNHKKYVLHLDMDKLQVAEAVEQLSQFIKKHQIEVLNIAGTRGSEDPAIYRKTFEVVDTILQLLCGASGG